MEEREVTMSLNEMIRRDKVRCCAPAKWMLSNTKEVYERHGLSLTGYADDPGVNASGISWCPERRGRHGTQQQMEDILKMKTQIKEFKKTYLRAGTGTVAMTILVPANT